jgi:hypothetical protein
MKRRNPNSQSNNNNNGTHAALETPTNLTNELSPSSLPNLAPSLTNLTGSMHDMPPASMLHYTPHLLNINNNKPTKV